MRSARNRSASEPRSSGSGKAGAAVLGLVVGAAGGVAGTYLADKWLNHQPKPEEPAKQTLVAGDDNPINLSVSELDKLALKADPNTVGTASLGEDLVFHVTYTSGGKQHSYSTADLFKILPHMKVVPFAADGTQEFYGDNAEKVKQAAKITSNSNVIYSKHHVGGDNSGIMIITDGQGIETVLFDGGVGDLGDALIGGEFSMGDADAVGPLTPEFLERIPDQYTTSYKTLKAWVADLTNNSSLPQTTKGLIDVVQSYFSNEINMTAAETQQAIVKYATFAKTLTGNATLDKVVTDVNALTADEIRADAWVPQVDKVNNALQDYSDKQKADCMGKIAAMHELWLRTVESETSVPYSFLSSKFGTPTNANLSFLTGMVEANGVYESWSATEAFNAKKDASFASEMLMNAARHPYLNASTWSANDSKVGQVINDQNLSGFARNYLIQNGKNPNASFYAVRLLDVDPAGNKRPGYVMWTSEDSKGVMVSESDYNVMISKMGQIKKAWE